MPPEPKESGLNVGCLLASFVALPVVVVAFWVGMNAIAGWLAKKTLAVLGPQVLLAGFGVVVLSFGVWGIWRVMTGRSSPQTTQRQKAIALAILASLSVLGGASLTVAVASAS